MHDFKAFPELTNSQMKVFYFDSPHKQIKENFTAKCVKVHDGDTITLQWEERDFTFPLRFIDIAAPELKEEGGIESRNWLEEKILGEEVDIIIDPKNRVEKWGRLLGKVYFDGTNIGKESVLEGQSTFWNERKKGLIPDFEKQLENNKWLT